MAPKAGGTPVPPGGAPAPYRYLDGTRSRPDLDRVPANRLLVKLLAVLMSVLLSVSNTAQAQEAPQLRGALPSPDTAAKTLTLAEAVELALANYPSVRASMARQRARSAEIALAKTAYLPKGYSIINENRASMNRVAAVIYPAHDIPVVADRVGEQTSFRSFWTANAGAGIDWEIYDFGLRAARVKLARAETSQAAAALALTRLEVATAAADAFLAMAAAQLKVRAEQANVDRMQVFTQAVHALVDADLRPGVDASRADAELALAKNELIEARQALEVAAATLAERLGLAGTRVAIDPGPLADMPPTVQAPPLPELEDHPLAILRNAGVKTVQAKEHVLSRTYFPHLHFESSIYGRGSGTDQRRWAANQGFLPVIPNWAVGLTVSFPFMSIFEIKARER
ncbi:MAG TPA: TolC family protein, partial [Candidatus Obscuribacterales bacterium]